MVKDVFNKVSFLCPVVLVLGWCCFFGGIITDSPMSVKLLLLSAARVLP